MTTAESLDKYISLLNQFVSGAITAPEFEMSYLEMFRNYFKHDEKDIPIFAWRVLNELFLDTDAYCADPDLRDEDDLDEKQLLASAQRALDILRRY